MFLFNQKLKFQFADLTLFILAPLVRHNKSSKYSLIHSQNLKLQCQQHMNKQIFSVVPLSKKMQNGKALYGVQLRLNGLQRTQQIWKTIPEYCSLQREIKDVAFDFQQEIQKELPKASNDQDKLKLIMNFVNQCKCRPDITKLIIFREFFQLTQIQHQYLDEYMRVNVEVKDMAVIDLAWDANMNILFTLHKPKGKKKVIQNFFKQLFSKQTCSGKLTVHKQMQKSSKWTLITQINLQSEPLNLQWSAKSSMLLISTLIGIYVYIVKKQGNNIKQELFDFIKIYNIKGFQYGTKTGNVYFTTQSKMYIHSINKQFTMEINPQPLDNITAITVNKAETKLYCSQGENLRIFQISNLKDIKQIARVQEIGIFNRIANYSDKFLFGLSPHGYVSVFQVQPPGKERLTNVLTNIDCPAKMRIFAFNQRTQMILSSNGPYLVLISTKNVPLFAGGSHKQPITAGIYQPESNLIVSADQEGYVIFYNLSFKPEQ